MEMTSGVFDNIRTATAPALGNHLWQSTVFVLATGLLVLLLRRNQAPIRYRLWLAASLKFLFPCSLLMALGHRLAAPLPHAQTQTALYRTFEQVSIPFASIPAAPLVLASSAISSLGFMPWLEISLAAVWLCGLIAVFVRRWLCWRRLREIIREASPLQEGREVALLRRLEGRMGMKHATEIVLSQAGLEPGIFGIRRPVLLWPAGISEHLQETHVEAILAHELSHVRRRDNLTAMLHMLVEAVFWFHPLVWWLGARLVEERECACDEEVVGQDEGRRRQAYAESILKTCEFCVEAPLACVSGVTGSDLKKRIVRIMTQRLAVNLSFGRKALLAGLGALAVTAPVIFGVLHASRVRALAQQASGKPSAPFEVASIKPNKSGTDFAKMLFTPTGMSVENLTLHALIRNAYEVQDSQLIGEPGWLNSDKYDVEAKIDPAVDGRHYPVEDRRLALQQLLADRLHLKIHRETRELPVYELVVAKSGPKLKESTPGDTYSEGAKRPDGKPIGPGIWMLGSGKLANQGEPLKYFISVISRISRSVDHPIVDKTDLTGHYDFTLQWTPEPIGSQPGAEAALPEGSGPSLFVALEEQLGLKLQLKKGPVEVLVIDHVERPSEN